MRTWLLALCSLSVVGSVACNPSSGTNAAPDTSDAGSEPDAPVDLASDAGAVLSLVVSPLVLTPDFRPTINDYYVRCDAGNNALTATLTDTNGPETIALTLAADQAAVVRNQYWIRCLPPDFPLISVTRYAGAAPTPGYYLVNSTTFAAVLDTNGTPVWYERESAALNIDSPATDTISLMPNVSAPFGTNALSVFDIRALDSQTVTTVYAVGGPTDGHELQVLPNGDHLVFTYPIESGIDLSALPTFGPNETIADCEIQEVDPSGDLVWSWLASDHVDPAQESLEPMADATINGVSVVDVFHCNSIDVDSTGNLLLSMRHTNAVFYIDRSTSQILWKLGGTAFSKDGATNIAVMGDTETTFSMQHDARFQANGDISLFDDHGASAGVARGVQYALDHTTNTATVAFQYLGVAASEYEGSFRRYPDGESVIGWGYIPTDPRVVTEIDANANDVLDVAFSGDNPTYRAVKVPITQLDIGTLRTTAAQ